MISTCILIVEDNALGHHFAYVRHVARQAIQDGRSVVLLTRPVCVQSSSFAEFLSPLVGSAFRVHVDARLGDRATRGLVLVESAKLYNASEVVVLAADGWLKSWSGSVARKLKEGTAVRLLVMRAPSTVWSEKSFLLRVLGSSAKAFLMMRRARLKNTKILLLRHWGARKLPLNLRFSGVKPISDYVECRYNYKQRSALRERLGLAPDQFYVSIIGEISARKNPLALIEAIQTVGADATVLLAGSHSTAILNSLAGNTLSAASLRSDDRWLSEDDVDAYVAASDLIAILHQDQLPSGILGKAIAAGVPCLVWGNSQNIGQAKKAGLAVAPSGIDKDSLVAAVMLFRKNFSFLNQEGLQITDDSKRFARDLLRA